MKENFPFNFITHQSEGKKERSSLFFKQIVRDMKKIGVDEFQFNKRRTTEIEREFKVKQSD